MYMNLNLNYAQVICRPSANTSAHTGVLDLKCMTKIANAMLILCGGKAPKFTEALDVGLVNWTTTYIGWLTHNMLMLQEATSSKCVAFLLPADTAS